MAVLVGYGVSWKGLARPLWKGGATRVAAGLEWCGEARFGR